MRIVHIITSLNVGGLEALVVDLVNEQIKTEEVSLIIINKGIDKYLYSKISENVTIYLLGRNPGSINIYFLLKLNYLLVRLKPEVIHCHNTVSMSKYIFHLLYNNISITLHSVGTIKYGRYNNTKNFLTKNEINSLKKFTNIFAISKFVKENLDSFNRERCKVIYNGINTKLIRIKKDFILNKIVNIVQVGNLYHHIKGQDIVLKALFLLKKNTSNIDFNITFIGYGTSKEYLESLSNELMLSDSIEFIGQKNREYIYNNLYKYDVLIQPSRTEGFGLSVIEGMYVGLPVIVSDIDALVEIIKNGEYGEIFKSGNAEDLSEKILLAIKDYNQKYTLQRSLIIRNYVSNNFDIQYIAKRYINSYELKY